MKFRLIDWIFWFLSPPCLISFLLGNVFLKNLVLLLKMLQSVLSHYFLTKSEILTGWEVSNHYLMNCSMDSLHMCSITSSCGSPELVSIPIHLAYFCTQSGTFYLKIWLAERFLTIISWTTQWIHFIFAPLLCLRDPQKWFAHQGIWFTSSLWAGIWLAERFPLNYSMAPLHICTIASS